MRAANSLRPAAWKWAVLPLGALLFAAVARAELPPLPDDQRAVVDKAIEKGKARLKQLQLPTGTWGADGAAHPVGYAALPALTLLECGVPKNDPVILKAETYIRAALPKMDDTYELSLSILFLDKLGNKRDEEMIQGLSLRLIAGQSGTGGWGYKCPNLETRQSRELFKILKEISAPKKKKLAADKPVSPLRLIPPAVSELAKLAVLQDFDTIKLEDPPGRAQEPVAPTTDNSDTQFAIIALWTAQRHGVPMDRTLQLIANRFKTSQSPDGSWGYTYKYDGGVGESAPMDCCGLLGLAVGHGLAHNKGQEEDAIKDPKIVNGFAAVNKSIGAPTGHTINVPLQNLYFLWSWERVGVLYDLPTLDDKDWFRWGTEGIVANQAPTGEWLEGGGYPAATPVANTCFALLFLRRSNLVADLTAALKLNPADLTKAIKAKIAPAPVVAPPPPPPPPAKAPEPPPKPTVAASPPVVRVAAPAPPPLTLTPTSTPAPQPESSGWGLLLGVGLGLFALLLLAAGGVVLLIHFNNQKKEAQRLKEAKRKKAAGKQSVRAAPADVGSAKKPPGKTGIRPKAK
jgi:hypothetical protein